MNPNQRIGQAQRGMAKNDTRKNGNKEFYDCTHVGRRVIFLKYNSGELPHAYAAKFLEPFQ
jgi:hypothetical protein